MEAPAGALQHVVATQCRTTAFQPLQFFVSWSGVLCLVYKGFPPPIASLKRLLLVTCNLPPENPGSLWPKTSLAALNDNITLTQDELALLLSTCEAASSKLSQACTSVIVQQLTYIHYMCRCLATALLRNSIRLPGSPRHAVESHSLGSSIVDADLYVTSTSLTTVLQDAPSPCSPEEPEEDELQNTQRVVSAANDVATYWKYVARGGNRISHYTEPGHGITLVHLLAESEAQRQANIALLGCIKDFKAVVEEHFPDKYTFFSEESLHITIRALS